MRVAADPKSSYFLHKYLCRLIQISSYSVKKTDMRGWMLNTNTSRPINQHFCYAPLKIHGLLQVFFIYSGESAAEIKTTTCSLLCCAAFHSHTWRNTKIFGRDKQLKNMFDHWPIPVKSRKLFKKQVRFVCKHAEKYMRFHASVTHF